MTIPEERAAKRYPAWKRDTGYCTWCGNTPCSCDVPDSVMLEPDKLRAGYVAGYTDCARTIEDAFEAGRQAALAGGPCEAPAGHDANWWYRGYGNGKDINQRARATGVGE